MSRRKKPTQNGYSSKRVGEMTTCTNCERPLAIKDAKKVEGGYVCNYRCRAKSVSSKIELTTPNGNKSSLLMYRKSIADMTKGIKKFALRLCPDNLLSVKMALMGAVRDVEMMMKERREKG